MEKVNQYTVGFYFEGGFEYTTFTANQMCNIFIANVTGDDSIYDMNSEYGQWFEHEFEKKGKRYKATFAVGNPLKFNVYEIIGGDDEEEEDEMLVEEGIPYVVLKIARLDDKGLIEEMYNLVDNL